MAAGILIFSFCSSAAAGEDAAVQFVRSLKQEDFARAYALLSANLKSRVSFEDFKLEQEEAAGRYQEKFGTSVILKAEELHLDEVRKPRSVRDQLQLRDINLGKLLFWNSLTEKKKRRIFQFVFKNDAKMIFGVDTFKLPQGTVVTNYEFLPKLQEMLSVKDPDLYIKRVTKVA